MNKEDCVRMCNEDSLLVPFVTKLFSNVGGVGLFEPWYGKPIEMI